MLFRSVTSVTVAATANDDNATYVIAGGESLVVGNNVITVTVTAEDGTIQTIEGIDE